MEKISDQFNKVKKLTKQQIGDLGQELEKLIRDVISNESKNVIKYIDQLKTLNPDIKKEDLCKKIISRKSLKAGGIGVITGVGGIIQCR